MKTRMLLNLGLPVMLVAGATVAVASARDAAADGKAAAAVAARANKALGKRDAGEAVALAEQAVALAPQDAAHRALLGRAYLQSGRFQSARATLEEAVSLDPRDGRAALNLALAQIATGDWATARRMLGDNAAAIGAADLGLALALAGDPAGAVALLTQAARQPGASPKLRQNLALSLALAGQWQAAKVIAAADTPANELDDRMLEWAALAQPRRASDQVAHLLGVGVAVDPGRPAALALNAPTAPVAVAVAVAEAAPVGDVVAAVAPADRPGLAKLVFGPSREVVQPLPVSTIRPDPMPVKVALTARPQPLPVLKPREVAARPAAGPSKGQWFVQLGAFDSPEVARDAWGRATRRLGALKGHTPAGMEYRSDAGRFYRLSVGGFAQADANAMCRRYRAAGGTCFVRAGAGDQVARWAWKPGAQLAMR